MQTSKRTVKTGVGQLTLTFGFGPKDEAREIQDDGPPASIGPADLGDKPGRKKKWHSLIDKVYALPNLRLAWAKVRANKGAAGADGMTVAAFARQADGRLAALHADLRDKSYRPAPVRRKVIPKEGGARALGIPNVRDRIVQQALRQVLEPVFEPAFSTRSHGFRPGRGCATALSVVDRAVSAGYTHVVDADIQSFFDTVNHDKLLDAVSGEVADGRVLKLIRRILTAGVWLDDSREVEPTSLGTPQGGPVSPLLANIYLHALDTRLTAAGYGLVRYADDFVIFAKSEGEARRALLLAERVLCGELGLTLHPEKTRVVSVDVGFEFLGFHYFLDQKTGRRIKEVRRKSIRRFRDAVRTRTPRLKAQRPVKARHVTPARLSKNRRIGPMIERLNKFLRGWHWYFKTAKLRYEPAFGTFDGFVRGRVRAAIVGRTGPGWWHGRIPNALLADLGLLSLVQLQREYQSGLLAAPPARKG